MWLRSRVRPNACYFDGGCGPIQLAASFPVLPQSPATRISPFQHGMIYDAPRYGMLRY